MHLHPLITSLLLSAPLAATEPGELTEGPWRAWLDSPGGELPFGIELARGDDGRLSAFVINGSERIAVPTVTWDGTHLALGFDHYDSKITARLDEEGRLAGQWTKNLGGGRLAELPFHAQPGRGKRFHMVDAEVHHIRVDGRWAVDFESDELAAVALFRHTGQQTVEGTFLTATGDYRYLAGDVTGDLLRLSVFDGAHAFLFHARLNEDEILEGHFWSRDSWHETWTAERNPHAALPDAFAQTTWDERASLADFVVPDLEGQLRSLAEPAFAGKAIVLQLFGSWCPNCHDEGAYLAELYREYRDRGLMVLGLAFELNGDFAKDAAQVEKYAERHGCTYPFFVVGSARSKAIASQAFPAIDRLRSYPTTVFMTGDGQVHAVHSGFSGPATGPAFEVQDAEFRRLIEGLLAEEDRRTEEAWAYLEQTKWIYLEPNGHAHPFSFRRDAKFPVDVRGDAVRVDGILCRLDRKRGALLDPQQVDVRYVRLGEPRWPLLNGFAASEYAQVAETHEDPDVRSEALLALAFLSVHSRFEGLEAPVASGLRDESITVRAAATVLARHATDRSLLGTLLEANLAHANAMVRRETVRTLKAWPGFDLAKLEPLVSDIDPIVRERVRHALAGQADKE